MKVALVHDYLTQLGGGEKVLKALGEMFPEAPIFTLIYDEKATNRVFKNCKIYTSFLQKIPGAKKFFRGFIWLMPLAVEQFDFSDFDLVISVSHSYGKGIITKPNTKHICYCLTPTRYLWSDSGLPFRPVSQFIISYLRNWDYQAAQRPDYMIASSENVRQRIKKYYNLELEVIYPPVETEKFHISHDLKDYFLMVGRLVPYKRFDIAIRAFSQLPQEKLFIIGNGPEKRKLERLVKELRAENINFLSHISDSEISKYYANCKALIFPQEEDFGIAPVEAMASGRPVIAFKAGGALETIKEVKTGVFFDRQDPVSLAEAIKNFNNFKFDSKELQKQAQRFSKEVFKEKISNFISSLK